MPRSLLLWCALASLLLVNGVSVKRQAALQHESLLYLHGGDCNRQQHCGTGTCCSLRAPVGTCWPVKEFDRIRDDGYCQEGGVILDVADRKRREESDPNRRPPAPPEQRLDNWHSDFKEQGLFSKLSDAAGDMWDHISCSLSFIEMYEAEAGAPAKGGKAAAAKRKPTQAEIDSHCKQAREKARLAREKMNGGMAASAVAPADKTAKAASGKVSPAMKAGKTAARTFKKVVGVKVGAKGAASVKRPPARPEKLSSKQSSLLALRRKRALAAKGKAGKKTPLKGKGKKRPPRTTVQELPPL